MLTQAAADQFPHHPGGPQGKGQFELFGAFVRDPGPHAPCLGLGQPAFAPAMGVQATVKQRLFTVTGVVAQPLIDGLTPDANRLRGFSLGLVQAQDQENRTDPKGLLRGAAEATKVFLFHAAKYNGFNSKCQVLCWEISILQAWLTLPSCLASSSTPTLPRMIFWFGVIAGAPILPAPP